MTRLPEIEYRILVALEAGKALTVADTVKQTETDQSLVMAGATLLAQRGLVEVSEESQEEFSLTPEGQLMFRVGGLGLPEREALEMLAQTGSPHNMASLPKLLGKSDIRSEIKWLSKRGWAVVRSGELTITGAGEAARGNETEDERLMKHLCEHGLSATDSDLRKAGIDVATARPLLKGRDELVRVKTRVTRRLSLTESGASLKAGGIEKAGEVTQLEPWMLASHDAVETASSLIKAGLFRKYDPNLPVAPRYPDYLFDPTRKDAIIAFNALKEIQQFVQQKF